MKKHSVKILLLMLAMVMVFLAACGGDDDTTPADTQGGENQPAETGETTPEAPPEPEALTGRIHEQRDFGGRVLRVGAYWPDPIIEIAWGDEPDPAVTQNYLTARMMWDNARRVEQVFNVRFEQVVHPPDDFMPNLTASILAGEPIADVVFMEGRMQFEAVINPEQRLIQPWNGGNLPASDTLGAQIYVAPVTAIEDYVWTIQGHRVFAAAYMLAVNLDIINAEGLPNPVDLYEAGEWTWDAMLDIMRRATRDTDGDNVIDQFGIAGQPGDIVQHLIGANDGIMVDAYFNYGFAHPNTVETLEFAEIIFQERLWSPAHGDVMYGGYWDRNFFSGAREANAALFPAATWSLGQVPPPFEFVVVPFPKGPSNTSGNTWLTGWRQGLAVPVGTDWHIDEILIILEEIFSWPGDEPELLFETGQIEWMRNVFLTEECVQRAITAGVNAASDVGRNVNEYYWILGTFAGMFWDREMDVMQAIEYFRNTHQDLLDQRFRN